jgi:hypothetical protein
MAGSGIGPKPASAIPSGSLSISTTATRPMSWLDEPLRIEEFVQLARAALRRRLGKRSPALPSYEIPIGTGPTFIEGGREEGYIERRPYDLAMLAARARDVGATHIGWG